MDTGGERSKVSPWARQKQTLAGLPWKPQACGKCQTSCFHPSSDLPATPVPERFNSCTGA